MTPAGSQDQRYARPRNTSAGTVRLWVVCAKVRCRVRGRSSLAQLWHPRLWSLAQLQERRPQERVGEIPQEVMEFVPDRPLELDFKLFTECLQNAPSGCAQGPGGCTNEMLRTCLDDPEVFQLLFRAAEDCASASMPETIRRAFMSASMTALQKPDGGAWHCNGHFFPQARCKDVGAPVWESGGSNLCPIPICIVNARNPGSHRRAPCARCCPSMA